VSECAEWRGWMWKRLTVERVFMCVLHHQPSATVYIHVYVCVCVCVCVCTW